MSDRGYYGTERGGGRALTYVRDPSMADPPPDYGALGGALGIGALVGILIGSNITFHLPVRRRR